MDGAPVKGESIPIRVFLAGYDLTPTMRDINKKFSVRYYLNLVLVDEEDRRYFKQQVSCLAKSRQNLNWRKKNSWNWLVIQYACNSLTNFQYEGNAMNGNGNHGDLQNLARKKFVKLHQVNLFLAVFSKHFCGSRNPIILSDVCHSFLEINNLLFIS